MIDTDLVGFYPNPVEDYIQIEPQSNVQINRISILAVAGALIKEIDEDFTEVDLSDLKSGTYLMNFEINGQKHLTKKVQKK